MKGFIILFLASCASAQYFAPNYAAAPTLTSQHSNILRSYGNLGQVSTYSKTIDTPFSSVSKSDVRVSNPGFAAFAAPRYISPVAHAGYAAPRYISPVAHAAYAAPLVQKAVVRAPGVIGVAYSAAPAVSHMTYTNGIGINYACE